MMSHSNSASAFLLLHLAEAEGAAELQRLDGALLQAGWRRHDGMAGSRLYLSGKPELPVRRLGPSGVVIGRYYGRPTETVSLDGAATGRTLLREGWGGYVALWQEGARLFGLRDPSGAIDLLTWSLGPVTVIASDLPADTNALLPPGALINWDHIARVLQYPAASCHGLGVSGLTSVAGGTLVTIVSGEPELDPLWRPADFAGLNRKGDPEVLRRVVDGAVAWLASDHSDVVGEVSGGFDSAVVATAARIRADEATIHWINYHASERESDEGAYVDALCAKTSLMIERRFKPVRPLGLKDLEPLAKTLRPGLFGLDVDYDSDIARKMMESGATAVLTGQGGDAVFFNSGTPALVIDRLRRMGLAGLSPNFLYQTGRWTRRSVWSLVETALRDLFGIRQRRRTEDERPRSAGYEVHPWLADIERLPPAKQDQVRQLVNCQVFWSPCLRAAAGRMLHPLLSQPVMEQTLAIPTDVLTHGGQGRALAKQAFKDRLPAILLARRGKGELTTFYGQVVLESLPDLGSILMDGELMRRGLIDREETEALLDPNVLIWSGDYNVVLIHSLMELWVRHWQGRVSALGQQTSR